MRPGRRVSQVPATRPPAVAGSFYPSDRLGLHELVAALFAQAAAEAKEPGVARNARPGEVASPGEMAPPGEVASPGEMAPPGEMQPPAEVRGLLVPHAGLVYSGLVAASGWRLLASLPGGPLTVVLLGTNHGAAWLDGIGIWETGSWRTPFGDLTVDAPLAAAILSLGSPFVVDRAAHLDEHSIEVQLPLLQRVRPGARIVPLAVAAGTGWSALDAGSRLGELLRARSDSGEAIVLAISTDMAHYPPAEVAEGATAAILPAILDVDPARLASDERAIRRSGLPGLLCGMCGIEPAVLGLAALRSMGLGRGTCVASATSADAGGPSNRTVGYLAVSFGA